MESKWCWMLVALCALLMSKDAALADDVAVKGVDSDAAVVMQEQAAATQQLSVEHTEVRGDVLQPQVAASGAPSKEEMEETQLPLVMAEDAQPKLEGVVAEQQSAPDAAAADQERKLEAAVNAEIAKQPSLQRLARHLRSFHDYQVFRARKAVHPNALLQRAATNIDDDDDDAIAEERAVRRRQRVRRRNSKNKVKRTHRNKHFANRKKSTNRKHSNRNSVRRKNVKRAQSKRRRNTNRTGVRPASNSNRRSTKRRRGSNSNKRRSGSKRRKSGRKSKRKSSPKKKKKTKSRRRRRKHRDELADENTARQQAPGGAQPMPIGDDNVPQDAAAPAAPVVELPSH